jgi:hypothetical protein
MRQPLLRLFFAFAAAAAAPQALAAPADEAEVARVRKQADEIQGTVAKIRGLVWKRPVEKGIKDREELRAFVMKEMDDEMPVDKTRALEKAYVKIGFIPKGLDLRKTLVDLYAEQIAGFYDPKTKELYLVEHGGPEQAMLMAHELTHALQDQNFDLLPLQKGIEDNDDRSMALTSVIEGDATVVMVAFLLKEQVGVDLDVKQLPDIGMVLGMSNKLGDMLGGGQGMEQMKKAPKILSEDLLFGYMQGASFCQRLIKAGGSYQAVSRAFQDLPQSSEQILHPEKYLGAPRDEPIDVEMPDLAERLGEGWKGLVKNVMGEFNTTLLFKEKLPESAAERAGAGWGGDAWQVLEGPQGELVFCWTWVGDTEKDAEEFQATYEKFHDARDDGSDLSVLRDGKTVVIVDGGGETVRKKLQKIMAAETKLERGYPPIDIEKVKAEIAKEGGPGNPATRAPSEAPPAAAAWDPAELKAPEGWTAREGRGGMRLFRGPEGEQVRVLETPMAAKSLEAELGRRKGALERGSKLEDYAAAVRPGSAVETFAMTTQRGAGLRVRSYYEVRGEKLLNVRVTAAPEKLDAALAALAQANPDRAYVFQDGARAAPKAPAGAKEPTLY